MSRIAYFDMFSGISGNMVLGAFLDAGVSETRFLEMVKTLPIDNYSVTVTKVKKQGIAGTHVEVKCFEEQPHRHLHHITRIIDDAADLAEETKQLAKQIFENLARAEAKIHNTTIEKIHFHEVGAVDAIIDIVGAAWCINELQIDQVYASPVTTGSGFVRCAHGMMPVPAPATQELLQGALTRNGDCQAELATPTGAAIISTLTSYYGTQPLMKVTSTSYGAGTMDLPVPNLLRLIIGEKAVREDDMAGQNSNQKISDEVVVIETNIDDMNPEFFEYVLNRLFEAGALDVYYTNIGMKKNRPGIKLSVLCDQTLTDILTDIILSETTSIGVRMYPVQRRLLKREKKVIKTSLGNIPVKIVTLHDGHIRYKAEYETIKMIAKEQGQSVQEINKRIHAEIANKI